MNKRILFITSEFPPQPGGIGNHAYCLAKELSASGYQVSVLTETREEHSGDWQDFLDSNPDLQITGIERFSWNIFTYWSRLLRFFQLLNRIKDKAAVIYSGKFSVWLSALDFTRSKSIVVVHGSEIKQSGLAKVLFKKGLEKACYIVCVSNYTKGQLIAHYAELVNQNIVVINNGFNSNWNADRSSNQRSRPLLRSPENNSRISLVTVGGIHKRKGQFNVVRALPAIISRFPNAEYHAIGLPLEKNALLELIEREKVQSRVIFHHGLGDAELREVLSECHVFIMLSEHLQTGDFEGFGIAAMEAMALGLPAIGSRNSGIADAIKDGYSGRLVDPKDPEQVADALQEIMTNYSNYSRNAEMWAAGFQWKHKVREYELLIEKL